MKKEIEKLKKMILSLSAVVEKHVGLAIKSIEDRDLALAKKVIQDDSEIDMAEVEVEEECLKILALYQPVAIDLRFVVAILKINDNLERIGDLAVNIAERTTVIAKKEKTGISFSEMARKTRLMLKESLDAFVNMDCKLARKVIASDDEVDAINREMFKQVKEKIRSQLENLDCLTHLLSVSRHLERIADLTTNIAEDVIYMVEGEIIRHKTEDYQG